MENAIAYRNHVLCGAQDVNPGGVVLAELSRRHATLSLHRRKGKLRRPRLVVDPLSEVKSSSADSAGGLEDVVRGIVGQLAGNGQGANGAIVARLLNANYSALWKALHKADYG